jgi:hypothetical protein
MFLPRTPDPEFSDIEAREDIGDYEKLRLRNIREPVLRIRIHRIHIFLGVPDPLVRGMDPDPALDPDPSIIMQK